MVDAYGGYDNADYYDELVEENGLSEEHAANHTVFFLRWLMEHNLVSVLFLTESADMIQKYRDGDATIHELFWCWDRVLDVEMLSEEGNAFAASYYSREKGRYEQDYVETLQGDLPTEFHVDYTEENYQRIKEVIDRRYRVLSSQGDVLRIEGTVNGKSAEDDYRILGPDTIAFTRSNDEEQIWIVAKRIPDQTASSPAR